MDPDLTKGKPSGHVYLIRATKEAEGLGTRIVANVVMLGAFREISDIVSYDALEKAMLESVPKATHDLNKKALALGKRLGLESIQGKGKD
jgi:2-oxoglutarate ferredoxin oxidoreductase subunit gamma